jgi:hypothetical protein
MRAPLFASIVLALSLLSGCPSQPHADTGPLPIDAARSDTGVVDAGTDASADAFVVTDVGLDALAVSDAGVDAFVEPADAGLDAFVVPLDAFVEIDAFVPIDAGNDAFVGTDAFVEVDGGTDAAVAPAGIVVISEIRSRGAAGASDEFIELYNPSAVPVVLDETWRIEARSNVATSYSTRWTGTGRIIAAHGHFLLAASGYAQLPAADEAIATGVTDASSVRLVHAGTAVDAVCYAYDAASAVPFASATYTCEGTPVTNLHDNTTSTNADASIERRPGGAAGNGQDTDDNTADFAMQMPSAPQSTTSPLTP